MGSAIASPEAGLRGSFSRVKKGLKLGREKIPLPIVEDVPDADASSGKP